MASSYSTGSKHEILWSLPIVDELAKETLDPSQLEEAEEIALMFIGNKTRKTNNHALDTRCDTDQCSIPSA